MPEVLSRSIRLTPDASPHAAAAAMLAEIWIDAPGVAADDRARVNRAVELLLSTVFPRTSHGGAAVCSLLVGVRDDRVEVTAAEAALDPHQPPDAPSRSESVAAIKQIVDIVRLREHGSITEWEFVRAREHARSFGNGSGRGEVGAEIVAELERQRALEALDVLDAPDDDRFSRITRLAITLFGVTNSAVNLVDRDRVWSRALAGPGDRTVPRDRSLCNVTITQDQVFVVPDIPADARAAAIAGPEASFYAGFPLYAPGGERVGALCVYDPQPRSFSAHDETTLRDLAALAQQELAVSRELARGSRLRRRLASPPSVERAPWSVAGFSIASRGYGSAFGEWKSTDSAITVTIGDAVGDDAGAAVLVATVQAALRVSSRASHADDSTDAAVQAVAAAADALGADPDDHDTAVSVFHALIEPSTGQLSYVDAGHGLAVVVRSDGTRETLPSTAPPLGSFFGATATSARRTLDAGDALVVVSAGALDLVGGRDGALERLATAAASSRQVTDFIAAVRDRVGARPSRDVSAVIVRRSRSA